MIRILTKSLITKYIIPHLSLAQRGYISSVPLWEIVNAILYKFKSGVHWEPLPIKSLIYSNKIKYGAIYHHFRKWTLDGSFKKAFESLVLQYRSILDLSLAFMDGTHSIAKRGGPEVPKHRD